MQGLALSSIGEFKKAEEAHLKSIQLDRNFLEAWAHLTQVSMNIVVLKDHWHISEINATFRSR